MNQTSRAGPLEQFFVNRRNRVRKGAIVTKLRRTFKAFAR